MSEALQPAVDWMRDQEWKPFPFQKETWRAYLAGKHGLLNAPTGSGKTYALALGILLEYFKRHPQRKPAKRGPGLQCIWITPLRALSKEIEQAIGRACRGMGLEEWRVETRTGDTPSNVRQRQNRRMPEFLITTPESLHVMLANKGYAERLKTLRAVVVDEWHELIGSKRGVQVELGLSRLRAICPELRSWAISATIGNLDEALDVFLGSGPAQDQVAVVRYHKKKKIELRSVMPDEIEKFPWSGHLGVKLLPKVIPIIMQSRSSLVFTNTRAQAEIWYQQLLAAAPELAGIMAMHHGSISRELREWTEDALRHEKLKAVVCTSSLDLGVDFAPVETIIQVGSPKGVARFMQRAGRSGHQPGATSRIWFVPTHSLELIEGAALRDAIEENHLEARRPMIRSFDVLVQYLVTLAISDGFRPGVLIEEVRSTHAFASLSDSEWIWLLDFVTTGGESLYAYEQYRKVEVEDGVYQVNDKRIARRHRLSMGTIVSDAVMKVKYMTGGYLGTIEEYFVSKLTPGDVIWFAGRNLEFVKIKEMQVLVRRTKQKNGRVPAWLGGRMSFSSRLSEVLRRKISEAAAGDRSDPEIEKIRPLLEFQAQRSGLPSEKEVLVELFSSREGHHCCIYPFEGYYVHEAIGALIAYRMSLLQPISFSIAVNDYGFELLSEKPIPLEEALDNDLFTTEHLDEDLRASVNSTELARRRFRDIAAIAGLVFQGYPGKSITDKHLQASSKLFFDVFSEHEPGNLLLQQAYEEVFTDQLEEIRIREALERMTNDQLFITFPERPTPMAFPIIVDRLRQRLSSEKLSDRIERMQLQFAR
ncbi:MAG: ligase-associated DNA damage response DEXH box helicase [Bacteroidota bacterium]